MSWEDTPEISRLIDECVKAEMDDSATKRRLWEKLGRELEKADFPKEDISSKIQEVVEGKLEGRLGHPVSIDTAFFYRVMKQNRWGRSATRLPPKEQTPLGEFDKLPKYDEESPHPNQFLLDGIADLITGCKAIYHALSLIHI